MTRKQIATLTALAIVVALIVIVGFVFAPGQVKRFENGFVPTPERPAPDEAPEFTEEIPADVQITEPEETIKVTTDPEREEMLGVYTVRASRSGYSPDTLTVVQGNIIRLALESVGGNYDLFIPATGNHVYAPAGETKQTSFRVPQSGTFRFECRDYCPPTPISGRLIVLPR